MSEDANPDVRPLLEAVWARDYDGMKEALRRSPGIVTAWQPIMTASFNGDLTALTLLLGAGADPNVVSATSHAYRPLHRTVEHKPTLPKTEGHVAVANRLLYAGADPQIRAGRYHCTPILLAALGGEALFIPLLRKHSPNDIYTAAALGDVKRIQSLLKEDPALAQIPDANGMTALHYAAASRLGIHNVARAQHIASCVAVLIHAGADVNVTHPIGHPEGRCTPLWHAATQAQDRPITRRLLHAGADPNLGSPLFYAVAQGYEAIAELLIAYGARTNGILPEGTPFLHRFVEQHDSAAVQRLLDLGGDPNTTDARGETPLHAAVRQDAPLAIIDLLLLHGALPGYQNEDEVTPAMLAQAWEHKNTIARFAQSDSETH